MTGRPKLPLGPVLTRPVIGRLPQAAGRFLVKSYEPVPFRDYEILSGLHVVTGIYLITDADSRIRWLGQACRDDDLVSRLADHHRELAKRRAFSNVRVLHLLDRTPPKALDAIEGTCADWLRLRGVMSPRRWPSSTGWMRLVS